MKKAITIAVSLALIAMTNIGCRSTNNPESVKCKPIYGQLSVKGTQLVGEDGNAVVLRGVSYGWHTWWPRFYNAETVKWFKDDWHCTVVRAAMGVEPDSSYLANPEKALRQIQAVADAAIDNGIYVIIDWHSHSLLSNEANNFFGQMAQKYGKYPNIIWEIFNEPIDQPWDSIKSYSTRIINTIRQYDPNNIILIGSTHWDQDIHKVAESPLTGVDNIMYTVHYYADTHKQWLRDRCDSALSKGIPIFISESGGGDASGDGKLNYTEWNNWTNWCEANKISWLIWAVSDKLETCSLLLPSAASEGGWANADLTECGKTTRDKIRSLNN